VRLRWLFTERAATGKEQIKKIDSNRMYFFTFYYPPQFPLTPAENGVTEKMPVSIPEKTQVPYQIFFLYISGVYIVQPYLEENLLPHLRSKFPKVIGMGSANALSVQARIESLDRPPPSRERRGLPLSMS
jgi:hypothetical protein